MASGSGEGKPPDFPRGLMDRHGAPAGKARLTSLRSPRDLTLGGIPKRVFVPNIPVRRERPAPGLPPEPKKKEPPKERSERGRGRGRGRGGRGRGDSNLVQIQSVFDQGPSIQNVKDPESRRGFGGWGEGGGGGGGGGGRGGGGRGGGGGGGGAVKTFKRDMDVDGKRQKILDMLTRDDFIADWDEDENDVTPLCVPSIRPTAARVKTDMKKPKEEPELDITIKQEPEESAEPISGAGQALGLPSCGPAPAFMNLEQPELTCAELFTDACKSGKEEMILFQLPNQLPGIPAMREEDQQPTTGKDKNDKEEEVKILQSSLRCFSEGYLGKLRVRKSGKVELVLGDHVLDVSMGIQPSFRQEAVSIRAEEGDKRMTLLGHVQHKMKIMPNFEQLYHAMTMEDT